jgi:hypothetical protein
VISPGERVAAVERSSVGGPATGPTYPNGSHYYYEHRRPRYVGLDGPLPAGAERLLTLRPWELGNRLLTERYPLEIMAAIVPRLWLLGAPRPLRVTTPNNWHRLWEAAGFTREGMPAPKPRQPLRLFRGGESSGWSWTPDPDLALAFASGFGTRGTDEIDTLWTTLAPPSALLGWVPLACDVKTGRATSEECVVYPPLLDEVRLWTPEEVRSVGTVDTWGDGERTYVRARRPR